jgi:hypothetical protein
MCKGSISKKRKIRRLKKRHKEKEKEEKEDFNVSSLRHLTGH